MKFGEMVLLGSLAACGYKVEEVDCTVQDLDFYNAQVDDLRNETFQMFLNPLLVSVGLGNEITAQDLADAGAEVQLGCATSIKDNGEVPLAGMDVKKELLWIDVDHAGYANSLEQFVFYSENSDSVDGYYAYTDGVGEQIYVTGHELAHFVFGGGTHSDETLDFIASIPADNTMTSCEGWTFVSDGTEDKVYDVQAEIACAYDAFAPHKREELSEL